MENIKKKNDRYQAIKDGEKTLRSMTDKIAEVMSKTRVEIRVSFSQFFLNFFYLDNNNCDYCDYYFV